MNISQRLGNSFKTGGICELLRKSLFYFVYKTSNIFTLRYVKNTKLCEKFVIKPNNSPKIIVSLTSFPKRFKSLDLSIKSILLQDQKPDKIIVYFDGDTKYSDLTDSLKEFEQYGVEYKFHNETLLKAHCKYYFAMQEYPNSIICTTDDDVILPRTWLSSLIASYKKYPECVSARRVHLIKSKNDSILPYNLWRDQWRRIRKPSNRLIATGVGGILYPPNCFPKAAFNQDIIKSIALNADDIWLKCWEVMTKRKVVWVPNFEVSLAETDTDSINALSSSNVDKCQNDIILNNIIRFYSINVACFIS